MFKLIIVFIIISICIYLLNNIYFTNKLYTGDGIVLDKLDHNNITIVPAQDIKKPVTENEVTFSLWLYLNEFYYNFSYWKHIMHKGTNIENKNINYEYWHNIENEIPEQSIGIWLHPNINNLRIAMSTENENLEYIDITNIKIQELIHYTFILNNKTLHIYLNNKLIITKVFKDKPLFNQKSMYFNFPKTFNGNIYNFIYLPKNITTQNITYLFNNKPKLNLSKTIQTKELFNNKIRLNEKEIFISNLKLPPSSNGIKFTYVFWLYIINIPENAVWDSNYKFKKHIFRRAGSPNINYIPKNNILNFEIAYKNNMNETTLYDINLENIKIQKWIHIGITIDNRKINIYLNGNIAKSTILPNIPFIYNKNLYIGTNPNDTFCYLFKGSYTNNNLSLTKIKKIYSKQQNSTPNI